MNGFLGLSHALTAVRLHGGNSYGGSQMRSDSVLIREGGCGVIAAAELLLYLHRYHPEADLSELCDLPEEPVSPEAYNRLINRLQRRYFPLIPHFGINGMLLTLGLNRIFHAYHVPYRAHWGLRGSVLSDRMEDMLRRELPVILAVGPDFPQFWKKHPLPLYVRYGDGSLHRSSSVRAHYVIVTGMDDHYFRISSWGREYYLHRGEYARYLNSDSSSIVSNIVYLTEI